MLREHILNKLKKDGIGQRQLAMVANVNESTISRYLNGYDELKFVSILKIVKYLFPEREKEYIEEYALTQKSQNARYLLEYCSFNRLWHISEQLIAQLAVSTNPTDREWAKIYEFELMRERKSIDNDQLIKEMQKFSPNVLEVQILHIFIISYIYFFKKKINVALEYIRGIDKQLEKVKNQFLHSCFNIRYGLLMANYYLFNNKIDEARRASHLLIDQHITENSKAAGYYLLGHSYLFENYQKAKEYLDQAINLFRKINQEQNLRQAIYTLSFIQSYWKIEREFPFDLSTHQEIDEYVFYLIQKGEKAKAKEIIDQMNIETLSDYDKAFIFYYLGLIEQDKSYFYQSVRYFRRVENYFHLQLPIEALRKQNEDELLLQIFNEKREEFI